MRKLAEALKNAGDGAFIVDENLHIVYWNRAAQEIVGFEKHQVIGRLCHQVLRGCDERGRLICKVHCSVAESAFRGKPVSNYDIQVREKPDRKRWLNISTFSYPENSKGGNKFVVHLFRDVTQKKGSERFLRKILEVAQQYHNLPPESSTEVETGPPIEVLTPREREILSLLARGFGTRDIARTLSISPNTARNHIQHILQKLHIHSRIEAVTYAIKQGLLE